MKVYIYGLFLGNRCVYVGQSRAPQERSNELRWRNKNSGRMKIFRVCNSDLSAAIWEEIWIKRFKAKGQAEQNKIIGRRIVPRKPRPKKTFILEYYGSGKLIDCYIP